MEQYKKNKVSSITFLILLLVTIYLSYEMVKPYILAVIMGAILALLCKPLYDRLKEGNKKRSKVASTIVVVLIMIVVIGPLILFTASGIKEGMGIAHSLSQNESVSFEHLSEKLNEMPVVKEFVGDTAELEQQLKTGVQNAAKAISTALLGMAATIPELLLQLALTGLACFFLLLDGPRFLQWASSKTPLDDHIKAKLKAALKDTTISTIWATLAAAAAQAAIMLVSFLILGVPAAFLAGGATFIFSWVPMIGSVPVWVIGAIYLGIKGSTGKVIAMILLGLFTGIIDNIIRPLVLQGRGEMHPLVSLVAIFGGINLFGILGVFIGPVIAAILISLIQISPEVLKRFSNSDPNSN